MTEQYRTLSQAEFDAWHTQYKADNHYPLQGRNAKTGALQPLSIGPTTEYVAPIKVDSTDVRFTVDEKVAVLPGKPGAPPTFKTDGTLDVVKTKADQAALDAAGAQAVVG